MHAKSRATKLANNSYKLLARKCSRNEHTHTCSMYTASAKSDRAKKKQQQQRKQNNCINETGKMKDFDMHGSGPNTDYQIK